MDFGALGHVREGGCAVISGWRAGEGRAARGFRQGRIGIGAEGGFIEGEAHGAGELLGAQAAQHHFAAGEAGGADGLAEECCILRIEGAAGAGEAIERGPGRILPAGGFIDAGDEFVGFGVGFEFRQFHVVDGEGADGAAPDAGIPGEPGRAAGRGERRQPAGLGGLVDDIGEGIELRIGAGVIADEQLALAEILAQLDGEGAAGFGDFLRPVMVFELLFAGEGDDDADGDDEEFGQEFAQGVEGFRLVDMHLRAPAEGRRWRVARGVSALPCGAGATARFG